MCCYVFRGIPYVSKDRGIRMQAIGDFFAENTNYDVISLQEVWTEHDYQLLRKAAEKNLPFAHYFYRWVERIDTFFLVDFFPINLKCISLEYVILFQWCGWFGLMHFIKISNYFDSISCLVCQWLRTSNSPW